MTMKISAHLTSWFDPVRPARLINHQAARRKFFENTSCFRSGVCSASQVNSESVNPRRHHHLNFTTDSAPCRCAPTKHLFSHLPTCPASRCSPIGPSYFFLRFSCVVCRGHSRDFSYRIFCFCKEDLFISNFSNHQKVFICIFNF